MYAMVFVTRKNPKCSTQLERQATVKFLNFRTQRRPNLRVSPQTDANGIANSEDPDQTAPRGAV